MGADGGSIPRRAEMVKTKAKTGQLDDSEMLKTQWTCCYLSKEPLMRPIVACSLGRLYNKESMIMFLINRQEYDSTLKNELDHIKSLKSLINCNLTDSKVEFNNNKDQKATKYFTCPVTGREMNGKSKFLVTKKCGCVLSEQALNQFPDSTSCLVCERKDLDKKKDLIELYPKKLSVKKNPKRPLESVSDDVSSNASLLLEEIKSTNNEIISLKKSKVTETLYFNNKK